MKTGPTFPILKTSAKSVQTTAEVCADYTCSLYRLQLKAPESTMYLRIYLRVLTEISTRTYYNEYEEHFQSLKALFFGITFTDGTIEVRVSESAAEYMEEGKVLHHCVFTNEYYIKEQSLILSARIDGKRIETIRGIT